VSLDPRRLLQQAAEQRVSCELLPRGGRWLSARVVRVEKSGVVLHCPGTRLVGGEDVRVWLRIDDAVYTFGASVLRAGVPVPDRSQHGLLLGFIEGFGLTSAAGESGEGGGRSLELVPPSGPPVSLLEAPIRLVELTIRGLSFTVPEDFRLVFVQGGTVGIALAHPDGGKVHAEAVVDELVRGEGYLLYVMRFVSVDAPDRMPGVLGALQPE